jgi:hypothetical protein
MYLNGRAYAMCEALGLIPSTSNKIIIIIGVQVIPVTIKVKKD